MLREQDVIRNELLTRYEKRNEDITMEVSRAVLLMINKSVEADLGGPFLCVYSWSFTKSRTMS